jgi:transcriptional regulator GlxA family with amidase domain
MTPCELGAAPLADRTIPDSTPFRQGMRKGLRDGETDRKIEQTIAYMTQHLNKPLPVARLAALANISPSHFFALFKRRTGCAPIDYFIRLRMHHARRLLDQTSLNVKEIAAALGYDDPFYFSRVFKSVNHVAPTEYRSMGRESRENTQAVPEAWQKFDTAAPEPFDRQTAAMVS